MIKNNKVLKVGDEVRHKMGDYTISIGIVTKIDSINTDRFYILYADGSSGIKSLYDNWEKTGRHFDIKSILDQIERF